MGDALGVDWASLVADVRRREQTAPTGGARDRWRPERVLTRLGLSLDMAGKETVQNILHKNAETLNNNKKSPVPTQEQNNIEQNGKLEEDCVEESDAPLDINSIHPVAAIQVISLFYTKGHCVLMEIIACYYIFINISGRHSKKETSACCPVWFRL